MRVAILLALIAAYAKSRDIKNLHCEQKYSLVQQGSLLTEEYDNVTLHAEINLASLQSGTSTLRYNRLSYEHDSVKSEEEIYY